MIGARPEMHWNKVMHAGTAETFLKRDQAYKDT